MKHYKDFIIHGANLVRYLKGHHRSPESELATAALPLAVAAAAARAARALSRRASSEEEDDVLGTLSALGEDESEDDFLSALALGEGIDGSGGDDFLSAFSAFGGGGDESGGVDLLSAFGGGYGLGAGEDVEFEEFVEAFEQCGIDLEQMSTKVMGAVLLYGSAFTDFDPTNPESFPGLDSVGPLLLALKDNDEKDCSAADLAKLSSAAQDYFQCTGMSTFLDLDEIESGDLAQGVEDDCKPVFDKFSDIETVISNQALDIGDSEINKCLRTLLGDNAVGNLIRYEYHNLDKTFSCLGQLGEDLPHCVISALVQGGEALSLPLSLGKKLACIVGSSYENFIEAACVGLYSSLDECLPPMDDVGENGALLSTCIEEGDNVDMFMDSSVVTGNKLPEFCSKVYKDRGMDTEELHSRFDYWNENREYGWTIETVAKGEDVHDEAKPSPKPAEDVDEASATNVHSQEQPPEIYKSNPVDISSAESSNFEDGEWEVGKASSESFLELKSLPLTLLLVAGLVVIAAVVVALVARYRVLGATAQSLQSRMNNVIYTDLAFKVEQHEMA